MRFEIEAVRHDTDPPITVYISKATQSVYQKVHCLHCGLPVTTTINQVIRLSDNPANAVEIKVGLGNVCKRCKQVYRFVLV